MDNLFKRRCQADFVFLKVYEKVQVKTSTVFMFSEIISKELRFFPWAKWVAKQKCEMTVVIVHKINSSVPKCSRKPC